jgi:hypothetical protein
MKTDKFVNTLEDVIRKYGAMDKLISDKVEISARVKDLMRAIVDDWRSRHYQHQIF